ncbi:SDR family NAD(P)-dependent oxidoreductase [Nocardia pseudovaccinii]|uniref:SDR family NAD(P)-dependent oxidoreductase n=1 Tax=Nocardia pseudovaccinii TaxID=189540 RepID=UPI0007A42C88|nr:SDR family oxidoreductase [Nocardia pseudovaccinii]
MGTNHLSRLSLDGQVAVVTGGGGGIGRGVALALASAGAAVVIGDIEPVRCEETVAAITANGGHAVGVPTDVMEVAQVGALIGAADQQFGRLDILVNNAGGVVSKPFLEQSERSWRRHIEINLVSMLAATSSAAPLMISGGRGGSIVNISSIEGTRAAPSFAVYAACKAGMISFTKSMALELSEHGIRVNCIAPDHTATPGSRGQVRGPVDESAWPAVAPDVQSAMDRLIPLQREGFVDECGDAAVYLCSRMASYVTGVTLPVDGGTSASNGWVRGRNGRWTLNEGLPLT